MPKKNLGGSEERWLDHPNGLKAREMTRDMTGEGMPQLDCGTPGKNRGM